MNIKRIATSGLFILMLLAACSMLPHSVDTTPTNNPVRGTERVPQPVVSSALPEVSSPLSTQHTESGSRKPIVIQPDSEKQTPAAAPTPANEILQLAQAFLTARVGLSPEQITTLEARPVFWSDGCLGVHDLAVECEPIETPGYLLIFSTPQGEIEIHSDASGKDLRFARPPINLLLSLTQLAGGSSGILGQALIGPACGGPVSLDRPCPDLPYQAKFTVLRSDGQVAAQFQADSQGVFMVELPAGDYILHPEIEQRQPRAEDLPFTVSDGEYTRLEIHFDSGMR